MSDAALEAAYEDDLKAERGYRALWIQLASGEEKRVRTFPDTPEWRVAADKLADELAEDADIVRVWNVPMKGSPAEGEMPTSDPVLASSAGAPSSEIDAAVADHPAGGRKSNICAHCRPRSIQGPSRIQMRHELSCPDKPGQWIDANEYVGLMPQGSEPWRKGRRW